MDDYCRYMGHSPITDLRHYATVDQDDLRQAHLAAMQAGRRKATPAAGA